MESALAERGQLEGCGGELTAEAAGGLGEEGETRLGEMQQEIDVSGAARTIRGELISGRFFLFPLANGMAPFPVLCVHVTYVTYLL